MRPYYEEKGVTIYHGDSRDVMSALGEFDLCLTDPPYNASDIGPNKRVYKGQPMKLSDIDYAEFCATWYAAKNARRSVFTPGIVNTHLYPQPKWQLCWHKPAAVSFNRMGGFNAWEPIFVYGDTKKVRLGQDYLIFNTLNLTKGVERDHPCPKPISLWNYLLLKFTEDHESVIDPFLGSGTTLIAAKILGRRAVGIDHVEAYCEMSANRLRQEVFDFGL